MKRFCILLLFIAAQLFAQDTDAPKNEETVEDGVGSLPWGSDFETVKKGIKGTLQYYEENSRIVSKDGEITYTYGFFYIDPELMAEDANETAAENTQAAPADENAAANNNETAADDSKAQFSYVVLSFPYLKMEELKKKYVEKYGNPSTENINNNRGVIIWETEKTMRTVWIDNYENEPYCRKIIYFSKENTEKLKDYKVKIFNQREIKALKSITP